MEISADSSTLHVMSPGGLQSQDPTLSLLLANALQVIFEICSELSRDCTPDSPSAVDAKLARLRALRAELVDWIDIGRDGR